MVKINKIALLINWPREIDMFIQLIEALPQKQKEIIVNDIKSRERGRNNLYKIIVKVLKKKKLKYKLFSKIYKKEQYTVVISTGETCSEKISTYSILKFIYARTIGLILQKTGLANIMVYLLNKPLTAEAHKNKLGSVWYPEKNLGKKIIKFPDGMDLKTKNYPYPEYENIFDTFLTLGKFETKIIKKKFYKKNCFEMGYLRYENIQTKKKIYQQIFKEFKLNKNKKIIFWTPTHIDGNEEADNINLWINKINALTKNYNIIIRPHPKTLMTRPNFVNKLNKLNYFVDKEQNRKIGELFKISDFVISDYGGTLFSAIYLDKPILALNLKNDSEFVKGLKDNFSLDLIIRKKLICLNADTSISNINKIPKLIMSKNYARVIKKLREKYFGLKIDKNINRTKNYLLNYL